VRVLTEADWRKIEYLQETYGYETWSLAHRFGVPIKIIEEGLDKRKRKNACGTKGSRS
jgi:hypothetical protein